MAYGYPSYTGQYGGFPSQYTNTPAQQVQSPQMAQAPQPALPTVRPVASIEEARAVPTDLMSGALTIMPDVLHGFIYTKQFNVQTGSADFYAYQRVQMQDTPKVPEVDLSGYVPRGEFDELKKRFNTLCDQLGGTQNDSHE